MLQKLQITFLIISLVLLLFGEIHAQNSWPDSQEDLFGAWKGEGRIIVAWSKQKHLSFKLQIESDGRVTGKIGDSQILQGKLELNNIFYRWIGNRKYIIDAKLSNYLIEKEKITRESIRVFLDFQKPFFFRRFSYFWKQVWRKRENDSFRYRCQTG